METNLFNVTFINLAFEERKLESVYVTDVDHASAYNNFMKLAEANNLKLSVHAISLVDKVLIFNEQNQTK